MHNHHLMSWYYIKNNEERTVLSGNNVGKWGIHTEGQNQILVSHCTQTRLKQNLFETTPQILITQKNLGGRLCALALTIYCWIRYKKLWVAKGKPQKNKSIMLKGIRCLHQKVTVKQEKVIISHIAIHDKIYEELQQLNSKKVKQR